MKMLFNWGREVVGKNLSIFPPLSIQDTFYPVNKNIS
jgi:hypothetical protein